MTLCLVEDCKSLKGQTLGGREFFLCGCSAFCCRTAKPGLDCNSSVFQKLEINRADSHILEYCIAE